MSDTTLSSELIKARKPHTCQTCWMPIEVGSNYRKYVMVTDGEVGNFKNCEPCDKLITDFPKHMQDEDDHSIHEGVTCDWFNELKVKTHEELREAFINTPKP